MWRKYHHGETVRGGYYLRNDTWEFVSLLEGGVLPEGKDATYYRVPLPVVLVAGPVAGLIWLLVYPLVIPLIVGYAAFRKVLAALAFTLKRASGGFATLHRHN